MALGRFLIRARAAWHRAIHAAGAAGSRGALLVAATDGSEAQTVLEGHDPGSIVTSAAFVDEERLVSLSLDRTLKLWRRSSTAPTKSVDLSRYGPLGMLLDESRRRALLVISCGGGGGSGGGVGGAGGN